MKLKERYYYEIEWQSEYEKEATFHGIVFYFGEELIDLTDKKRINTWYPDEVQIKKCLGNKYLTIKEMEDF